MQWFKHSSSMRHDPKIRRTINRYGLAGYGLYNIIIESITESLTAKNPIPDLQETCEDIAAFYNEDTTKVKEMAHFLIQQGLISVDAVTARITCTKIYEFIEASQTRSEEIRQMIAGYRIAEPPLLSQTVTDMHDRIEENRIDNTKSDESKKETEKEIPRDAKELAKLLYTLHRDNIDAGYKVSDAQLVKWAEDIDKLHRIDKREWNDIETVIRWVKTPGQFWAPNIMSGGKLREKYSALIAKCKPSSVKQSTEPVKKLCRCGGAYDPGGFCVKCGKEIE